MNRQRLDVGPILLRREYANPDAQRERDPFVADEWQALVAIDCDSRGEAELAILGYRLASKIPASRGWTSARDFRSLFPKLEAELAELAREWFRSEGRRLVDQASRAA